MVKSIVKKKKMDEKLFADKNCDNLETVSYLTDGKSASRAPSPKMNELPVVTITAANSTLLAGNPATACAGKQESKPSILEKAEINEAVTKVLQGYNWSLVPSPTK